tara:strand:- start:523 stop:693 length:171 start_codon:yes stop_codon:yes gene_type:complete
MEDKKQTTLIAGGNARFMNEKTGLYCSGKPTGQGYGAARKGPAIQGTIKTQVKKKA